MNNISLRDYLVARMLPVLVDHALSSSVATVDADALAENAFRVADAVLAKSHRFNSYPEQNYTRAISAFSGHA